MSRKIIEFIVDILVNLLTTIFLICIFIMVYAIVAIVGAFIQWEYISPWPTGEYFRIIIICAIVMNIFMTVSIKLKKKKS